MLLGPLCANSAISWEKAVVVIHRFFFGDIGESDQFWFHVWDTLIYDLVCMCVGDWFCYVLFMCQIVTAMWCPQTLQIGL